MRSFTFAIGTPGAGEVPVASIRLYESANGLDGWGLVDTVAVDALVDDGEFKRWDSAAANPSNYARLAPVSAGGLERPGGVILPPAASAPDTFTVFCWTTDLGLAAVGGISMKASPSGKTYAKTGAGLAVKATTRVSDDSGYVAIELPADAGVITITIDRNSVEINSAGLSGQSINVANLLA